MGRSLSSVGVGRVVVHAAWVTWALLRPAALSAGSYDEEVLEDAPIAYWRLGERDVLDPIVDASGNGLDGVFASYGDDRPELGLPGAIASDPDTAVLFQRQPGFSCFDCGQGHMPLGVPLDLGLVGDAVLTLEAWFKLYPSSDAVFTQSAFPRILHYHTPGGQYGFGVVGDDSAGYPDKRTVWASLGAPPPPAPFEHCGMDPTAEAPELGCEMGLRCAPLKDR